MVMGNKKQADMESATEVVKVDAPPARASNREGVWKRRLSVCVADEGQWYRVFVTTKAQAATYRYNLSKGTLRAPEGIFEPELDDEGKPVYHVPFEFESGPLTEPTADGDHGVFARYVGWGEDGAPEGIQSPPKAQVEVEAEDEEGDDEQE